MACCVGIFHGEVTVMSPVPHSPLAYNLCPFLTLGIIPSTFYQHTYHQPTPKVRVSLHPQTINNTKMPRALKDGIHNPNDEHASSDEDQGQEQEQEQQDEGISRVDHDAMGMTTQGRPPRVSRRRRSEYTPSWQRAKAVSSTGHTGSKYRSTSRH